MWRLPRRATDGRRIFAKKDMEAPHVRLLDFIVQLRPRVVDHELIGQAMPGLAFLHESVMGTLRRHALIREVQMVTEGRGVTGQSTFRSEPEVYVTELGKEVLQRIRDAGTDATTRGREEEHAEGSPDGGSQPDLG